MFFEHLPVVLVLIITNPTCIKPIHSFQSRILSGCSNRCDYRENPLSRGTPRSIRGNNLPIFLTTK